MYILQSHKQAWTVQEKVKGTLPEVLPHKYHHRQTLWAGILGQELDIEKGLCFIGKQAKGLCLAFLRPAMQTATCQEEMPSVQQVQ